MVDCLRTSGYKVDLASDGHKGMALGRSGDYVVMTVDRMLPCVDGLAVIQRRREHGIMTPTLIIEQPDKFTLVINLKTAKALGLTIPPSLLAGG